MWSLNEIELGSKSQHISASGTLLYWNKKFLIKKKSHFEATACVYITVTRIKGKASVAVKSSLSFVLPLLLVHSLKCHPGNHLYADISTIPSPDDTLTPRKGISNSLQLYGDSVIPYV